MEHETIDPEKKTKPFPRILKPLTEEKNYFRAKINMFSSFQVIEDIKRKLTPRQKDLFLQTCFGQFLNLERILFSGQLIHHILLRQLASEHTDKDECNPMIFELAGKKCEFGLKDFALITGLDCGEFVELTVDEFRDKLSNGIRDKFFSDKEKVSCKDVAQAFWSCESQSDDDVLKLAQLYLLEGFLLSKESGKPCHDFSIELVDNSDEFDKFPWGRYVYERTVKSMRLVFERRAKRKRKKSKSRNANYRYDTSYHVKGFPFVLQYWAYERFPLIGEKFGKRIGTGVPRMLNWGDKKQPNFKMVDDAFKCSEFQVGSGIKPTEREMGLDYFRYFLRLRNPKEMKVVTDIVEEDSPIHQAEVQLAPIQKMSKKKVPTGIVVEVSPIHQADPAPIQETSYKKVATDIVEEESPIHRAELQPAPIQEMSYKKVATDIAEEESPIHHAEVQPVSIEKPSKKKVVTDIVEEESPIHQAAEQPAPIQKTSEKKVVTDIVEEESPIHQAELQRAPIQKTSEKKVVTDIVEESPIYQEKLHPAPIQETNKKNAVTGIVEEESPIHQAKVQPAPIQKMSKQKVVTEIVAEESPIHQAEVQPAPIQKTNKQKVVNYGKVTYSRVKWLEDLKSEIIASVSEEVRKIAREEISRSNCLFRDEMNANVTQLLNKHLCKAAESVPDVVHIEMDDDDDDGDDDDDDGDEGSVQRKRKRSLLEPEDEIPCFTVDLFQHPHHDDKMEFDQWIKVGQKKNNKKMKYSYVANKLHPAFDFTIMKCDKKDWFFSLNESEEWLSSSHIDVALYYIRKKKNDHPDVFKCPSTTTDSLFYGILNATYEEFKKDPKNFLWSREGYICKTLQGIEPRLSVPWAEVDVVHIPVNVDKKHWVVAAIDLREWRINVYDSFRNANHNQEVVSACLRIAEMLPWILNSEGYFGTRKDIKEVTLPLDVKLVGGIPEQESGGDSGMFMLKFIEFLIQGMPLDICNRETISFFRNKMAVELYSYGKKRMSMENKSNKLIIQGL